MLIAKAREHLGSKAHLALNFDMIVERRCRDCREVKRFLRPFDRVYIEELQCEQCNGQGYEVLTHNLGLKVKNYKEDFLDLPLSELGVPPLDILRAYGTRGRQINFELTGDAVDALNFKRKDSEQQ